MAKHILLRVLQNYLGKWIDGITSENLKYGVWRGTMHLQDLQIKPEVRTSAAPVTRSRGLQSVPAPWLRHRVLSCFSSSTLRPRRVSGHVSTHTHNLNNVLAPSLSPSSQALANLKLPVTVKKGFVGELSMVVPWTALQSKPVQITLKNVQILVVPQVEQEEGWSLDKEEALEFAEKMYQLELRTLLTRSVNQQEDPKDAGRNSTLMTRLANRIIDNIQVIVEDVSVRYEDRTSHPTRAVAGGVVIERFSIHSTNAQGDHVYVDRGGKKEGLVFKHAQVEGLAVYVLAEGTGGGGGGQPLVIKRMVQ